MALIGMRAKVSGQSKLELLAEEKVKGPPIWEGEQDVLADFAVFWRDVMD